MTGNMNLWVDKPIDLPRNPLKPYESFLTFITAELARPYPAREGDWDVLVRPPTIHKNQESISYENGVLFLF